MDTRAFGPAGMYDGLRKYLRELPQTLPCVPKAVLVISAHWEAALPTVLSHPLPPMLYDYTGFPKETYAVKWSAPGAPHLAQRVRECLANAGIDAASDDERGYDHGVFVPMSCIYPNADVATIALSLQRGLDPKAHLAIGRALQPLLAEGVWIVGSGMSYHNMRGFFGQIKSVEQDSRVFDAWLSQVVSLPAKERSDALVNWESAPKARACHPREEHLLPLMVVAGAAGDARGRVACSETLMGAHVSAFAFDQRPSAV